jgi:hypothetical protein
MAFLAPFRGRRHVAVVALGAALAALGSSAARRLDGAGGDRSAVLVRALEARGLSAAAEDVRWVDGPRGIVSAFGAGARAIVRASAAKGEPADLYLVEAQLSPEGVLLRVGGAYDLTETSGADESPAIVRGERVAYVTRPLVPGAAVTVHLVDLAGQGPHVGWTRLERAQNALTSWQQLGQLRGAARRTFAVEGGGKEEGAAADVALALDDDALVVRGAAGEVRLPLGAAAPGAEVVLPPWLREEATEVPRPGNLVTWAVDRVRAIPWIGDDTMQTIKAVAFTALDFVLRHKEQVTGDTGAASIAADLGQSELEPPMRTMPIDPEIGWPPSPLDAYVQPALPGEGQWHPLDRDPFVRSNEGLPPAFLTTFIRSDSSRKATRVYVALWDPRQIELHMMAGSVEPKSATGEAGPGLIPRTPEVMKRVVAASNAGFQALHGEFGMMADGVVYLPPKPYAATVAVQRDGSTAFGSWPAETSIPESILSYRQNMTVMVQDEKFNPYNRSWWGGTPPGWADKTHTVRTGICLTLEHFVAYFYGADISPEALAQAMISTRCSYGIALDMNAGHSGLEFYKVAPANELEAIGRPLQTDWEAEGDVPGLDGWKFRGRRLIRGMGLMHFPRYIKREARDYFYMTLRHVLPGANVPPVVQPPAAGEGEWHVKGLPQHGFPYALATTSMRVDPARPALEARLLKIDPRAVDASPAASKLAAGAQIVAVLDGGEAGSADAPALWHSAGAFSIGASPPVPEAVRLATGHAGAGVAAVGVADDGGMLVYVELAPPPAAPTAADAKLLDDLLGRLGCGLRLPLAKPLAVALGGDTDLAGTAVRAPVAPGAVRLARATLPGGRRMFEDTPVVPFNVWYPLQQQRIRYFKKPAGQAEATPGGDDPSN